MIAWLQWYCTFSDNSVVSLNPRLDPNTPNTKLFSKKNHVLLLNFFSSSNMFFIRLFLANIWEKNRRSPCLFPHKLLWKVDMVLRSQSGWIICAVEIGARYKIIPIVFEVCTRDQSCFRLFLCVSYRQHRKEYNKYQGMR